MRGQASEAECTMLQQRLQKQDNLRSSCVVKLQETPQLATTETGCLFDQNRTSCTDWDWAQLTSCTKKASRQQWGTAV
jgi:hypothetical protein